MLIRESIERIFRRAVKQGYEPIPGRKVLSVSITIQANLASYVSLVIQGDGSKTHGITVGMNDVLFHHEFAKALWPSDYIDKLQEMAMHETVTERIRYVASVLPKRGKK